MIAFLDRSDSYHPLFRRLFADPPPLVTSALVVAEGYGWFLRRYDGRRAIQFLNLLEELPRLAIEAFSGEHLRAAAEILRRYSDRALTLADAHGLAVMRRRRISVCWSTDRHLGLMGASLVN